VSLKSLIRKIVPRLRGDRLDDEDALPAELDTPTVRRLQRVLGCTIHNRDLFVQALLHRSFPQRSGHATSSNERLEYLGDSVLNLIVGEQLYHRYPNALEGELTKIRSRLVNRKALAAYSKALRLSDFILMSPSAAESVGKGYDTIIADTFEAIVAAIYLDRGFDAARRFVEHVVSDAIAHGAVATSDENYKSKLLEYAQSRGLGVPRYLIVREEGPDHDRTFTVDVLIRNERRGTGTGKNKKDAEQAAASQAIDNLR
jgi:ribonuclease III